MVPDDQCKAETVQNGPKRSFTIYCEQALKGTSYSTQESAPAVCRDASGREQTRFNRQEFLRPSRRTPNAARRERKPKR